MKISMGRNAAGGIVPHERMVLLDDAEVSAYSRD
jgi:hypothetical protein